MDYQYIDTDEKIYEAIALLETRERIAVDFEGEFNLHVYGEHLCLIQIYDGSSFYLIDPRMEKVTKNGLRAFFSSEVKKLWFDCQSDASLVYKNYGLTINNIYDVRILAEALGFHGNLKALESKYLGIDNNFNKKKNQQANWLKRPLSDEQIGYALEDVAHLMALEDVLVPIIIKSNLEKQVAAAMKKATTVKKPLPGWTHVSGWKRMNNVERVYARHIYIARDKIAKRFNVPAARVMDKHLIAALSKDVPLTKDRMISRLDSVGDRFRSFLIPALWEAIVKGHEEVRNLY